MNAVLVIAAINASLALVEKLLPLLKNFSRGDITPEQQSELRRRYAALRAAGDAAFTGPEWERE